MKEAKEMVEIIDFRTLKVVPVDVVGHGVPVAGNHHQADVRS